jgi:DNA-directed RNA polymerase alpha subunit
MKGTYPVVQAWDFVDDEILWGKVSRTILETLVDDCDLSTRTRNCLINGHLNMENEYQSITTIEAVTKYTEQELLRIPNFGRRSLNEIKHFLAQYGLELAKQPKHHTWQPKHNP